MNALTVLFGGGLTAKALENVFDGKNSLSMALERGAAFPGASKTVLLINDDFSGPLPVLSPHFEVKKMAKWSKKALLEALSNLGAGFDCTYYAWADCPFLDPALAGAIADRHLRYAAEYSYADGWPYGFAPEILAPGTAGILAKILGDDDGKVERDTLFAVLQKDINAFDIETEISPVDLRSHRISLQADSKRNLLLLTNFVQAAEEVSGEPGTIPTAALAAAIIEKKPEILRTLPNFYPVQVSGGCPQACSMCPYPQIAGNVTKNHAFMDAVQFEKLLEKISAFSDDAVIDLSLWGELSLHPGRMELIRMTLARPNLALIIETSGIGWKNGEAEEAAALAKEAIDTGGRTSPLPPLSWIVSLDTADSQRYREVRGPGFAEAVDFAKKLFTLFPNDAYVQAVRTAGAEDDIEKFYRSWKEAAPGSKNVIIQKYDDFCGALLKKQASDISPVIRQPCWHIMRDFPVLIDGRVPLCREDIKALKGEGDGSIAAGILGNAFTEDLAAIWQRGKPYYQKQCEKHYTGLCAGCDEYYT
ncbi:MAG: spiro-SPASM protein, partial [Treponema sp.]|nr:spiro-SPASM protein [Treponema sp.]